MIEINNKFVKIQYIKLSVYILFLTLICIYLISEISLLNGYFNIIKLNLKDNNTENHVQEFDDNIKINISNPFSYINNKTKDFLITLVKNATKCNKTIV